MARLPRYIVPGQPQHVIQRGNNRQAIFYAKQDYHYYLEKLLLAANKHDCHIHAYVLMTNHVHLLVSPLKTDGLSKMMQMLGRYYVQYFNRNYHRTGTLWEGRYKATLINTDEYLFTCMRYIEQNPVRAGMVHDAAEYQWSSYQCNALGVHNALLHPHYEYEQLGSTLEERQRNYQALFTLVEKKALHDIRESTNRGWVLGNEGFQESMEQKMRRRVSPIARGGDRKSKLYQGTRSSAIINLTPLILSV